jgi:hypothetical protein
MAENQTRPTRASVKKFIQSVPDEKRRADALAVLEMMKQATRLEPQMWGPAIIGFGSYHYKYASGREGDAPLIGFSPRKQNLALYLSSGFDGYDELMQALGKYSTGKVCLYIKRLEDVHQPTLKKLMRQSFQHAKKTLRA